MKCKGVYQRTICSFLYFVGKCIVFLVCFFRRIRFWGNHFLQKNHKGWNVGHILKVRAFSPWEQDTNCEQMVKNIKTKKTKENKRKNEKIKRKYKNLRKNRFAFPKENEYYR